MAQEKMAKVPEAAEATEEWKAFSLEQRGIDYIPEHDRTLRPLDLLWMWGGTPANVLVFVYGSLLIVIGRSFWQAVGLLLLTTFAGYPLLRVARLLGPKAGPGCLETAQVPVEIHLCAV